MADLRVIDRIIGLAERLTVVRPGSTRNVRRELRDTLLEELDFRKEARYQDIFRRNARKKARKTFFTAPRVYFDLSDDAVLVQEFVSGLWLWEVIGAIEQKDPEGLLAMQRFGIDPAVLARRILWVTFWSGDENLFFHADPHPANIVVGRDNTLTFVDFGSCGSFDDEQRWALEQMVLSMQRGDASGMAKGALKLLEPLRPIDVAALAKDLETEYQRVLVIFRTKARYTEWWERTSARQWLAMVTIARRHGLQLNLHTLRMIRATLLYDTLVLRLDRHIDRYDEYARFRLKDRARWARERWQQRMRGLRRDLPLTLETLAEAGDDLMSRGQHALSTPVLLFRSAVDKWAYAISVLSRMTGHLLLITGAGVAAVALAGHARAETTPLLGPLWTVLQSGIYRVVVAGITFLNVRRIMFRLADPDSRSRVQVSGDPLRR